MGRKGLNQSKRELELVHFPTEYSVRSTSDSNYLYYRVQVATLYRATKNYYHTVCCTEMFQRNYQTEWDKSGAHVLGSPRGLKSILYALDSAGHQMCSTEIMEMKIRVCNPTQAYFNQSKLVSRESTFSTERARRCFDVKRLFEIVLPHYDVGTC